MSVLGHTYSCPFGHTWLHIALHLEESPIVRKSLIFVLAALWSIVMSSTKLDVHSMTTCPAQSSSSTIILKVKIYITNVYWVRGPKVLICIRWFHDENKCTDYISLYPHFTHERIRYMKFKILVKGNKE